MPDPPYRMNAHEARQFKGSLQRRFRLLVTERLALSGRLQLQDLEVGDRALETGGLDRLLLRNCGHPWGLACELRRPVDRFVMRKTAGSSQPYAELGLCPVKRATGRTEYRLGQTVIGTPVLVPKSASQPFPPFAGRCKIRLH